MKGKIDWLKQGFFVLLPELDELGRTIMYVLSLGLYIVLLTSCAHSHISNARLSIDMGMPLRCPRIKQWRKW